MVQMTMKEWKAEGRRRFGDDVKDWKFKCVRCGNVQTTRDFEGLPDTRARGD